MGYQKTIEYLFGLQKHGIKFGLENSRALLAAMGDPHRRFRSVHVAGTNGKGSTSQFLATMLRSAGLRVGLYTSPHLVSFTERIRIDGVPVSEARVVDLARRAQDAAEGLSPTFFEVTTAMSFTHFAEEGVEVAVVEAGMGGRLDSTNVITPLVSVITTIDIEHAEYLGPTIEAIAGEKAGIIKPGVPVVTGVTRPDALRVLEARAAECGSALFLLERDFGPERVTPGPVTTFDYRGMRTSLDGLAPRLAGRHQVDNACLAVATAELLGDAGVAIEERAVREGLRTAAWEGRLERVAERPDVLLDGAHNPAAAKVLAAALRDLRPSYRGITIVIGILSDKDAAGILGELVPLAERLVLTMPRYARALNARRLAELAAGFTGEVIVADDVAGAVDAARMSATADGLIVVTGSLYVVGEARAALLGGGRAGGLAGLTG